MARCQGDTCGSGLLTGVAARRAAKLGTCAAGDDRKLGSAESTTYGFVKLFIPLNPPHFPTDLHEAPIADRVGPLSGWMEKLSVHPFPAAALLTADLFPNFVDCDVANHFRNSIGL